MSGNDCCALPSAEVLMEFLIRMDTALFMFLNVQLANPLFDFIMPIITNKQYWIPVWLMASVYLVWKGGARGRWILLMAILAVTLADQMSAHVLKPLIQRVRPCNALADVHLLVARRMSFSMPSSHAANFFALATVFSAFYKRRQWIFWSLAALVAYSRIAVGVHYPADVLAGAFLGWLCGQAVLFVYKMAKNYLARKKDLRQEG